MHLLKKNQITLLSTLTLSIVLFFSLPVKGMADDFSDSELESFANAVVQIMSIQQQGQQQMMAVIEEADMTVQRFNEITMQVQEMGVDQVEMSEEEAEVFIILSEEIEQIQINLEDIMIGTIEDEGITIEKYEEIMAAYQQDPELQQRVQQLFE